MSALRTVILVGWLVFWAYWLIAAGGSKPGTARTRRFPGSARIVIAALVLTRVFGTSKGSIHDDAVQVIGVVMFVAGLGVAVCARLSMGRNWGMPMTEKNEPELVTSGPYRLVRHPIYTGILLAMLGSALAADVYWLIPFAITAAYFVHSARVEERLMAKSFPATYPSYRAGTKMLIPFVL